MRGRLLGCASSLVVALTTLLVFFLVMYYLYVYHFEWFALIVVQLVMLVICVLATLIFGGMPGDLAVPDKSGPSSGESKGKK